MRIYEQKRRTKRCRRVADGLRTHWNVSRGNRLILVVRPQKVFVLSESHRRVLSALIGSPLRQIGRAADLLWIHFGQWQETPSRHGGTRQVGQWALHVQTVWRFVRDSEIVVGVSEMYQYAEDGSQFNWSKDGESRFDRLAARLNQEFETEMEIVTDVTCDNVGGFSLLLKSGLRFDVFPCAAFSTPDVEFWRFFEPATENDHYVVETIEGRTKG